MKTDIDIHNEPELALNALLDEINKQRRLNSELQSDLRTMRTREIRLNKNSEILKSDNSRLKQDLALLEQKLREVEIQLTLPESDRTFIPARVIEPFSRKPLHKTINWTYIIVPLIVVGSIVAFKWKSSQSNSLSTTTPTESTSTASDSSPSNSPSTGSVSSPTAAATSAANQVAEEGYLIVQNPLGGDAMVRVMDGFSQKARVLAWINPGEKYRIRAQSPTKMRRTYLQDGKSVTFEDFFYKISDKEQWIFGHFTSKRLTQ